MTSIPNQLIALGEELKARERSGLADDVEINLKAVRLLDVALQDLEAGRRRVESLRGRSGADAALTKNADVASLFRRIRDRFIERIEHITPPSSDTAALLAEALAKRKDGSA
jgi:hypothetical protein